MHYKKAAAVLGASIFSLSVMTACGAPAMELYGIPEPSSTEAPESESAEDVSEDLKQPESEGSGQDLLDDIDEPGLESSVLDESLCVYGPPEYFSN